MLILTCSQGAPVRPLKLPSNWLQRLQRGEIVNHSFSARVMMSIIGLLWGYPLLALPPLPCKPATVRQPYDQKPLF